MINNRAKRSLWTIISRLYRAEYFVGLWIGAIATAVLWFRPASSPPPGMCLVAYTYSGLLYSTGFLVNAIGDRNVEIHYTNFKQDIAQTVMDIGPRRLMRIIVITCLVAMGLGLWCSIHINSATPIVLGGVGIVTGIGYSLPPLRFKVRGFCCHALTLSLSAFFLPMFLITGFLFGEFNATIGLLSFGYALAHYGLEIGNQMQDAEQDAQLGIQTVPSASSTISSSIGIMLLVCGVALETLFLSRLFSLHAWRLGLVASLLAAGYIEPLIDYSRLIAYPAEEPKILVGHYYARWQTFSMLGYLGAAILIRVT